MHGFDPSCFGFSGIVPGLDPFCFRFSGIVPRFDPSCFGFSGIVPGFDLFCFGFSDIASRFDPFYFGFSSIVPGFDPIVLGSLVLTQIWSLISRSLRYSPGYDSFSGTHPDPTLFWDSLRFYLFYTHPDLTHFMVLVRIHSPILHILRYSPRYDPSFWLLRYLPEPFFDTFPDWLSYSLWHCLWISFVISSSMSGSPLLFQHRARVPYLLWHRVRFSPIFSGNASNFLLSSLASCLDSFSFLQQCAWVH